MKVFERSNSVDLQEFVDFFLKDIVGAACLVALSLAPFISFGTTI